MRKIILNLLIDFITGNVTWGIAFIMALSNLLFDNGYINLSNTTMDWGLFMVMAVGLITVLLHGEPIRRFLKNSLGV